jgi:hypothetical protein
MLTAHLLHGAVVCTVTGAMAALGSFAVDVSCGKLALNSTTQQQQQQQPLQCTAALLHSVSMVDIRSHIGAVKSSSGSDSASSSDSGGNIVVVKVS